MQRADCVAQSRRRSLRLADGDVAGREVEQDLGAGQRRGAGGRDRRPEVLADLDVEGEAPPRRRRRTADRRRTGRVVPGDRDRRGRARRRRRRNAASRRTRGSSAGRPWGRRRAPGRGGSPRRCCRACPCGAAARRRPAPGTGRGSAATSRPMLAFDRVEQRVLEQQVVDRVGREAELGEHHQSDPRLVAGGKQCLDLAGVAVRLGHANARHASTEADELMPVGRKERGHRGNGARSIGRLRSSGESGAL